jgi:hypothetical protein
MGKAKAVVVKAAAVRAGDIWQGRSNAERKAWLKRAECATHWDTTTFADLPEDVQVALEGAR